jgi:hypothetical protein
MAVVVVALGVVLMQVQVVRVAAVLVVRLVVRLELRTQVAAAVLVAAQLA